ncbi:unnamed protein product [Heterobilharzia americana]|nr:unnamed protein product [Heterobilharzia americana]
MAFQFFGYLSMDVQKQLLKSITQAKGSNQTFIFGHHPTSTVVSQDLNLRSLIGDNAFAYLCGHLHTLHGTTKRMYVSQPQGYWEWELGDWRENRYYRIVAVDHDLVSFVDVVKSTKNSGVTEWPIILITNPKNSQFLLPNKEPVDRIKSSTHIRILVWSKWPIQSVSVKINDIFQGYAQPATLVDDDTITPTTQSPLYILSWNPSQWSDASHSFHTIEVTAKDTFGNQRTVTQPFSFQDPTEFKTGFLSRYFISTNLSTSVAVLYYMLWILMCTFVILPRFFHRPRFIGCLYRTRLGKGMYRLSSTNRILFVVLIYMLYSISCPIFMGYLVDDEFGYVFCYGIYINGIYLPEQLTYVLAAAQLLLLFIFLLSFSIHCGKRQFDPITSLDKEQITQYSDNSLRTSNRGGIRFSRFHIQIKSNSSRCILIALVVHTFSQLVAALIFIWFPYGFIAFLLSPGCILPIIVSWLLFIFCPQPDHVKHSAQ